MRRRRRIVGAVRFGTGRRLTTAAAHAVECSDQRKDIHVDTHYRFGVGLRGRWRVLRS
jgi:hypothetical protein